MSEQLIIDCFAGGGGASVGIEMALGRKVDIAINHDPRAIIMHKVNHRSTLHLTEDIFTVDLQKYVKGRPVALMWASPDCTSHSKAKGGQPRKSGLRMLPWAVFEHAKKILPNVIIMENVEEIQQWGPVDSEVVTMQNRTDELISKGQIIDFYNNNFPDLDDGVHWSRRDIIENLDNIHGLKVTIVENRDEPKKWIRRRVDAKYPLDSFECPCCGYDDDGDIHFPATMYCPKCGQKLEGAE